MSCSCHYCLTSRTFSSPQRETLYPWSSHSVFPPPCNPWQTTVFTVLMNLLNLGVSHKWHHTTRGLLVTFVASFTQHHVFEFHPCCRVAPDSIPFLAEYYSVVCLSHTCSPADGRWGCLHLLAAGIVLFRTFRHYFCLNTHFPVLTSISLGMDILGHKVILCLTYRGTTKLIATVAMPRYTPISHVLISPCSHQSLFFVLFSLAILVCLKW